MFTIKKRHEKKLSHKTPSYYIGEDFKYRNSITDNSIQNCRKDFEEKCFG